MAIYISFVDILKILAAAMLITVIFMPKKNGYEYNALDKKGVLFNGILSVVYVPLSIMGICTIFFADAPTTDYSALKNSLLNTVMWSGFSIPILSIFGIVTSVIARKRGKSKFSFIIQFLPIPVFILMLILMAFWDKV